MEEKEYNEQKIYAFPRGGVGMQGERKMKVMQINRIFKDTAYVRMGGSPEEKNAAEYLKAKAEALGMEAWLEEFPVSMSQIQEAVLTVDGKTVPCKGYFDCGEGRVEAPLYYLRDNDPYALSQCRGKIVLVDRYMGYWLYQDLLENGAVGFLTFDGDANYPDRDIDQRELRAFVHKGNRILGANINAKDAIALVRRDAKNAVLSIRQTTWEGKSHNVIADLPGEADQWIVLTAHYDSTSLSQGAYDNMSGAVGLLGIAEALAKKPRHYGLRFLWCGSEERGLLGSKAYCDRHESELSKVVLNINLDMIGCIMGKFIYCVTAEERLCHYIQYLGAELGFPISGRQDVYSSDSTPFADKGVPAVSFARIAPHNTATIHNSYDTRAVMKAEQMVEDIDFLAVFTERMCRAKRCPVERKMPDNMKTKRDEYFNLKRPEGK